MAQRVFDSPLYALVRLAAWAALFVAACADGLRHRAVRSRGWQLYVLLLANTALFVWRDLWLLFLAAADYSSDGGGDGSPSAAARALVGAFVFFSDVAEAAWMFTLLAIAGGFCIVRPALAAEYRGPTLAIPGVFLGTSLVVDFVTYRLVGASAFTASTDPIYADDGGDMAYADGADLSSAELVVFAVCAVANTMALVLVWFFLFDFAGRELPRLEAVAAGRAAGGGGGGGGGGADADLAAAEAAAAGVGHEAAPTVGDEAAILEEGQNASHLFYGSTLADDIDAAKSVADRVADHEKARLLRQFVRAACVYLMAAAAAFILPAFVPAAVDAALAVVYNGLLLAFLGALLWVFRMREGNQYLVLGGDAGGDGDDGAAGGGAETTTDLGVELVGAQRPRSDAFPGGGATAAAAGAAAGAGAAQFTLGEGDDDEGAYEDMDPAAERPPPPPVAAPPAGGGVEVRALPATPEAGASSPVQL